MSCRRAREQGAAAVLGALQQREENSFVDHLGKCQRCADEVDDLHEVAVRLALALPQHEPPGRLRECIVSQARREADDRRWTIDDRRRTKYERRRMMDGGRAGTKGDRRRTKDWSVLRPSSFVLRLSSAAGLAAAFAALLWSAGLQSQLEQTRQQLAATTEQLERTRTNYWTVAAVLASPNLQVRALEGGESAPGSKGKLWIDPDSGQGMLMARELPGLPEDQAYQVWLTRGDTRVSAGLLRSNERGAGSGERGAARGEGGAWSVERGASYYLVLRAPGRLTDYERLGVTREPAGGSPGPTGPRVLSFEF
jgi:hypothetical protein